MTAAYAVALSGVTIVFAPTMLMVAVLWWPLPSDEIAAAATEPVEEPEPEPVMSGGYQIWCRGSASPVETDTEPVVVTGGYHPILSARPHPRSFVMAGRY